MRAMSPTPRAVGTEDRAWVGERRAAPSSQRVHAVTHSSVAIQMRDGVTLSGTLYAPVDSDPCPGILIACGYGAMADAYFADTINLLAQRGYLVLFAKLRGLPPSEGTPGLYERFGTDSYDLIEWLARRPECNGRIGMFGASLLGLVQYLAAREAPPSLKVILPDDAGSDNYWYLWHPGGMSPGPGRAARQSVMGAEREYALAAAHPNFDAFWRERTVQAEDFEAIARRGVAVFLTSGWDSYLLGSTKSYEWLKAGQPGERLKMWIGPWGHGAFLGPDPPIVGPPVLPFSGFEYSLLWLDRWLREVRNGVDEEPPVLIYVQGPNEWRFERDWPLPDERRVRLYLREEPSGTCAGLNDGSLNAEPPGGDRSVAYEYSPHGPYNMAAVTAFSRPRIDKSPYEARGLVWTSESLAVATEMTGHPSITFWAALSATDTDFVVEITDVSLDASSGRLQSLQVTRGYLNAMRHFSRSDPEPLVPGRPYRFELELYPTSYVFAAGHRIRVTLQGSAIDPLAKPEELAVPAFPGVDPALLATPHGPGLNPQGARVTVFQNAQRPACIDLPLIGSALRTRVMVI
jgi:predicted acyl esterase